MIPDLRDVLDTVRVLVCPLRYGAGMKGKLLTAMSYGVPVVTTTIGVEGIAAHDGEHLLVADDPAAIAAACLRVYTDPALWQMLSASGMRLVQSEYSLASGRNRLRQAIELGWRQRVGLYSASPGAERQSQAAE